MANQLYFTIPIGLCNFLRLIRVQAYVIIPLDHSRVRPAFPQKVAARYSIEAKRTESHGNKHGTIKLQFAQRIARSGGRELSDYSLQSLGTETKST